MGLLDAPGARKAIPPRVILLAPRAGESGVGDYADDFAAALREHVEVVELRHGPPGSDGIVDIWRFRRRLRDLLADSPGGTVVHAELSGGATPGFWAVAGLGAPHSATVHDAPRPVWFPWLTRGVQRSRLAPVLVRAMSPLWLRVERRVMRDLGVVTMTVTGAELARSFGIGREVRVGHLIVPRVASLPPPWHRPLAVGLFGHVYRGKGFGMLGRLRRALPPEIAIRVAGRGTETLPVVPGVDYLGSVDGCEVDEFFASVRLLLLPYRRRPIGGLRAVAASAAQLLAAAYDTPSVAIRWPAQQELGNSGGCVLADDPDDLARIAETLVGDQKRLEDAHFQLVSYRESLTTASALAPFFQLWAPR